MTTPITTTWTVAELGRVIATALKSSIPGDIWLTGEIRNLRKPNRTGHRYFELAEPGAAPGEQPKAKISITLFRNDRVSVETRLGTPFDDLADGIEIRLLGRVDWWIGGGQLRVVMSDIDPAFTLGRLDEQRRQLLEALRAEGLLDKNARVVMPPLPLRVGLVTSAGSAAHADFVDELIHSGYPFDIDLADARVQGADATRGIVDAVERLISRSVDVIAIVRGGGSTTDLAAFDHGDIARAIANSPVPVFTGIGHEIDRSVADEVAHTSAKTPTAAAAAIVDIVATTETALLARRARLEIIVQRRLGNATTELATIARRVARATQVTVNVADNSINGTAQRVSRSAARCMQRETEHLESRRVRVRSLDPARSLARGWSYTKTEDGILIKSTESIVAGTRIVTTVAGGRLTSTVNGVDPRTSVTP